MRSHLPQPLIFGSTNVRNAMSIRLGQRQSALAELVLRDALPKWGLNYYKYRF
jgi:hypothetical protein